jgi:hypothetical protein
MDDASSTAPKPFRLVLRELFLSMVDDESQREKTENDRDEDRAFRLRLNRDFLAALRGKG